MNEVVLESRWADVRGQPMHYIVSTPEPQAALPLVLVHGVGLSHRYLLPAAVEFARGFRVFVPDLPGFGLSFKPARVWSLSETVDGLAAWLETLQLGRAALLGNSIGCQYVIDLAVRYPHLVDRAILQGPTCDPLARTFPRQLWRWNINRNRENLSSLQPPRVRFPSEEGEPVREVSPATMQDYWDCGVYRLVKTFQHALADRIEEKLPRMQCPTLVVQGARDPIVPQRWAEDVTRLLPLGRMVVLPGVPHTANLVAPLALYRVCRPFLLAVRQALEKPAGSLADQNAGESPATKAVASMAR